MYPNAPQIVTLYSRCLASPDWPQSVAAVDEQRAEGEPGLWHWIGANHRFDLKLWLDGAGLRPLPAAPQLPGAGGR